MLESADYVIVGAGLTGATLARQLHDAGREVLVLERRAHLGGNVHDQLHPSGIRWHTYGPHYFRTNAPAVWDYVNRFAEFYPYAAVLKSLVDGRHENWPVSASYIRTSLGEHWQPEFTGPSANFEQAALAMMPRLIYEKFVRGYTEKQWGVPAHDLSPHLAGRFEVHADDEPRLKRHAFQGLPVAGYAAFMHQMLAGLPVRLETDFAQVRSEVRYRRALIYTGPIDEFFDCDLGRLKYRGQQRVHTYLPGVDYAQPSIQVNRPSLADGPSIRTIEWKHLLPPAERQAVRGTLLTYETPFTPSTADQYEYPFPDAANAELYRRYRRRAAQLPNVLICGRLGEYRYYDMDQAIARALRLSEGLLGHAAARTASGPTRP
jgi:UDP-galactopyranose mutase